MTSKQVHYRLALRLEDPSLRLSRAFNHSSLLEVVGGLATKLVAVHIAIASWRLLPLPFQRSAGRPRSDPVLRGDWPDDSCRRFHPGWMLGSISPGLVLTAGRSDIVPDLLLLEFLGPTEHKAFDSMPCDCRLGQIQQVLAA